MANARIRDAIPHQRRARYVFGSSIMTFRTVAKRPSPIAKAVITLVRLIDQESSVALLQTSRQRQPLRPACEPRERLRYTRSVRPRDSIPMPDKEDHRPLGTFHSEPESQKQMRGKNRCETHPSGGNSGRGDNPSEGRCQHLSNHPNRSADRHPKRRTSARVSEICS